MLNAKIRGWEHIISMGFHVIHFTELTIRYFRLVAMGLSPFQEREMVDKRPLLAQYPRKQLDFCC